MKKLIIFAFALTCFFAALSLTAYCAEITEDCTFESSAGKAHRLNDSSHKTKVTFDEDGAVRIESENDKIAYLYVIWDNPVGVWRLDEEQTARECGKNGFIHEFIALDKECSYVVINVPKDEILCDVRVFSQGDIPSDVQIWSPPYERADLLMLPTHSDDDHLYFGGTMPYYSGELGMRVQVAYITNHWGEPVRTHELLNGLWTVGITSYPVISEFKDKYTDSLETARDIYDSDEMRGYIVELIRRFKPYVVLAHDLQGEYGHGAHMLSALLVTEAVQISMDDMQYPDSAQKYGTWDVPKTYLHNYEENQICMEWDKPLDRFDGKTGFEMAKEGFACHESQLKYDLAVIKNGRCSCRFFGLYRSTVGFDVKGDDFFENVVFEDDSASPSETGDEQTTVPETVEDDAATGADVTEQTTVQDAEESTDKSPSAADTSSSTDTDSTLTTFPDEDEDEKKQRVMSDIICVSVFAILIIITAIIALRKVYGKK